MNQYAQISKFWRIASAGRNAALDLDKTTGEIICQFTRSPNGDNPDGYGSVPRTYGENWTRIVECKNGNVQCPKHFLPLLDGAAK